MARIVVIGNAAGGKSTLARKLAARRGLKLVEIDNLLWQKDWRLTPADEYARTHAQIVAEEQWIIEGLGRQDSIAARIERSTEIVLIDMPLWAHYWLAAERQTAWKLGRLDHPPAGNTMPPTQELFRTMWDVDKAWMPGIRLLCDSAERAGKVVSRLGSLADIDAFSATRAVSELPGQHRDG